MLTLTRKIGEEIKIGDDIVIVVKEIRRNQVRVGIQAPRDIPIMRAELEKCEHGFLAHVCIKCPTKFTKK